MKYDKRKAVLAASLGAAAIITLSGCGGAPRTEEASLAPGQTGPADQQWLDKHARFAAAIEGLNFESGVVEVTLPLEGTAEEALQLHQTGLAAYDEGRYIDAAAAHARAIRIEPDLAQAYEGLGAAVLAHGKVDDAIAARRTALQIDPERNEARYNLAISLWMQERSAEAIDAMQAVLEHDPQRGDAHERLAIWRYYAGEYEAAWTHVRAARALDYPLPPQFIALLEAQMADPGSPSR